MNRLPLSILNTATCGDTTLPGAVFFPTPKKEHTDLRELLGLGDASPRRLWLLCSAVAAYPDLYSLVAEKTRTWDATMTGTRLWSLSDNMELRPDSHGRLGVRRFATEWPIVTNIPVARFSEQFALHLGAEVLLAPYTVAGDNTFSVDWPEKSGVRGVLHGTAAAFTISHTPVRIDWATARENLVNNFTKIYDIFLRHNLVESFYLAEDVLRSVAVAATALSLDNPVTTVDE